MSNTNKKSFNQQCEANILVVDDNRVNLRLLVSLLTEQGYKVRPASNGAMALTAVQMEQPDLILLDIMMPDMDGYQVCEQLKANKLTRDIPVIFVSALDETLDKVTAFSIGGVDYISKPFQAEEVLARVKTHLTIRSLQKNLQNQVAELDAFAHTVAHDLKNPLGLITGYANYLVDDFWEIEPASVLQGLQSLSRSAQKATNIIEELLLLAGVHKQSIFVTPLNMANVVLHAQHRLSAMTEKYQGEIILPKAWPTAAGYAPWIEEVWVNYLSNGLKYGGQPPRLELGATPQSNDAIRFWIRDNGQGLSPAAQATLFAEFIRLNEVHVEGHGLGLSIVRRIVQKLGGQVGVESEIGQGSTFYFTLPNVNATLT